MILGDFNFHYDRPADPYVSKILDFMFIIWSNRFMFLLINEGIYLTGLCIDQRIIFCCQAATNKLTSYHLASLCHLDLTVPEPITVQRLKHNINSIDRQQFSLDINSELDFLGNPSAEQFHCCLHTILDNHAPLSSTIVQHKYSPWYIEICAELQTA